MRRVAVEERQQAAVVALFMAGLALGNTLGVRLARGARPVRRYALAELGIALGAALCTALLPLVEAMPSTPARYALAALALLFPTACMGVTWPLLTEDGSAASPSASAASAHARSSAAAP